MDLKELLGDEVYTTVLAVLKGKGKDGKDVELGVVNDGSYLPKVKFDEVNEAKKALETQLGTANATIGELKKANGDNEALQGAIKAHEETIKTMKAEHEAAMTELKFNTALSTELLKANVIDADLVGVKLDKGKIKLNEDGTVSGLSEQLADLKTGFGFLFKTGEPTTVAGAKPTDKTAPLTETDPGKMTYSQMLKYQMANPGATF